MRVLHAYSSDISLDPARQFAIYVRRGDNTRPPVCYPQEPVKEAGRSYQGRDLKLSLPPGLGDTIGDTNRQGKDGRKP
ncbi:hypothetical protein CHELA20_52552 [Hyphomicrobiales bacterium]|nr:hypothetical protein CHELA41_22375 [Hyphomicrobiales bacterium]CAH1682214.1 hypothetical protein CHELA20_52552 [Hyphomicrobiales bacterium]